MRVMSPRCLDRRIWQCNISLRHSCYNRESRDIGVQLAKSHDGKRVFIIVTSMWRYQNAHTYARLIVRRSCIHSPYNWWCSLTVVTMSTNNNGYFHSVARVGRLTIKCENRYRHLQRLRSLTSRTCFISARFSFIDFALPAYYCCHVYNENFPSL